MSGRIFASASARGAKATPHSSAASSASAISPPDSDSAPILRAVLLNAGRPRICETSAAVSSNSSSVKTWIAPLAASAASQASTLPATAPVCAITAALARSERPLFNTITGLPASAALRAMAINFCGFLICSAKTITVRTAGSSMSASR